MGRRRLKDRIRQLEFIRDRLPLEVPLLEPGYGKTHKAVILKRDAHFDYFWATIHDERRRSWQHPMKMSLIYFEKYGNGIPKFTQTNRIFLYIVPVDVAYAIAVGPKPVFWLGWWLLESQHPLMDTNLLHVIKSYM